LVWPIGHSKGGTVMIGYQLSFFTVQDRLHGRRALAQWLLDEARHQGIRGATLISAAEGFGHARRLHSSRFFELTDQPLEVTMAVTAEEAERFFMRLQEEDLHIFYIKTPIEFGVSCED
jgi:PII-like signaling protein